MRIALLQALLAVVAIAACQACSPAQAAPADGVALEGVRAFAAVRPSAAVHDAARTRPVEPLDEFTTFRQDVGSSTAVSLFGADIADPSDEYTQNLRIVNRGDAALCFWPKERGDDVDGGSVSTDCATSCAAGPRTCVSAAGDGGTTTDGDPILAGATYTIPSDMCACALAETGTVDTTATRVVRTGG